MTETVRFGRRRAAAPEEEERLQLRQEMDRTRLLLNQAYADFNIHSDPDLVDACVYTINALRSRYSYLVRQVKQLEGRKEAGQ